MSILLEVFIFILSVYFMIIWFSSLIYKKKYIIDIDSIDLLNYKSYFFNLFLVSLFILILIMLRSFLGYFLSNRKPKEIDKSTFMVKILETLNHYLNKLNLPFKLYSLIFEYYGTGGTYSRLIRKLGKKILNIGEKKASVIMILFVFLPRFLIVMVFLIEIYTGQLHYYFYSLYLLLIPLIFRLILFVFSDITIRVMPEMQRMIIKKTSTEPVVMPDGTKCLVLDLKLSPEFDDVDEEGFFKNIYYPILFLEGHMGGIIMPLYQKILQISLFFYYSVHALGLSYLLFLI